MIAISADLGYAGLQPQLQSVGAQAFLCKPFGAAKLISETQRLDKQSEGTSPPASPGARHI